MIKVCPHVSFPPLQCVIDIQWGVYSLPPAYTGSHHTLKHCICASQIQWLVAGEPSTYRTEDCSCVWWASPGCTAEKRWSCQKSAAHVGETCNEYNAVTPEQITLHFLRTTSVYTNHAGGTLRCVRTAWICTTNWKLIRQILLDTPATQNRWKCLDYKTVIHGLWKQIIFCWCPALLEDLLTPALASVHWCLHTLDCVSDIIQV